VLVVDESEAVCKALQRDLTELGHHVVYACRHLPKPRRGSYDVPYVRFDIAVRRLSRIGTLLEGLEPPPAGGEACTLGFTGS